MCMSGPSIPAAPAPIPQIQQHYAQFGDKLPDALDAQLGHLAAALLNG